jgi:DNA-binding response OmpR family regulator
MRLLVIEDEPDIAHALAKGLRREGLEQLTKTENSGILPVTDHGRLTV